MTQPKDNGNLPSFLKVGWGRVMMTKAKSLRLLGAKITLDNLVCFTNFKVEWLLISSDYREHDSTIETHTVTSQYQKCPAVHVYHGSKRETGILWEVLMGQWIP